MWKILKSFWIKHFAIDIFEDYEPKFPEIEYTSKCITCKLRHKTYDNVCNECFKSSLYQEDIDAIKHLAGK
jgi:hypothetical protein